MKKPMIISLISLVLVGLFVSRVKYEVVFLRDKLKEVNAALEKYSDDFRIQNAEWSYLNSPKRLKSLCEKYLPEMQPAKPEQVKNYNDLDNIEQQSNTENKTKINEGTKKFIEKSKKQKTAKSLGTLLGI